MFHFRILHFKDPYTQDTFPSPKKNNVEGSPEHFWFRLNNTENQNKNSSCQFFVFTLLSLRLAPPPTPP